MLTRSISLILASVILFAFQTYCFANSGKHLGYIKNGVYHARIGAEQGLGSFSVELPAGKGYIKEELMNIGTYVSFTNDEPDYSIFRVNVTLKSKKYTPTFNAIDNKIVIPFKNFIVKSFGQPVEEIYKTTVTFKGHKAFYIVYTQDMPGGWSGLNKTTGYKLTHGVYIIDYDKYVVVLWAEAFTANSSSDSKIKKLIIERKWAPEIKFVNSFQLH